MAESPPPMVEGMPWGNVSIVVHLHTSVLISFVDISMANIFLTFAFPLFLNLIMLGKAGICNHNMHDLVLVLILADTVIANL
jgi:hypothetical protein